jgi:hypothetical protein
MFCPTCHEPNPVGGESCHACDARLPDRRRVYVGQQFILLSADVDHPIAVRLDDDSPVTVSKPTLISRHRHAVAFGDSRGGRIGPRGILHRRRPTFHFPLPDQPRLDAPRLDLTAVVTERRVYRPDDEARIFIVAPDHSGGEVELEVRLAGQEIMRETVTLNPAGLALLPYADLEEGEYTVRVRRVVGHPEPVEGGPQRPRRDDWAECHFSVAEFTLSPLIALLESHTYADGALSFHLRVLQLSVPYTGEAELGLQCATCDDRVVQTQKIQVQEGAVAGEFDLSDHDGPFKIQVTTPQGETAIVDLPGSGVGERERIVISPLGQVAEASLLPGDDTQPVRGLHVGYGDVKATPLRLESAIAREARFTTAGDYVAVQIVAHNPLSGENAVHEWRDVTRGNRLTVDVNPPFTLFTIAAATSDGLYESWATVVRPPDLDATLTAPDQAAPGDHITVTLSATSRLPAHAAVYCLLLAYDARLEHESPLPKLGQRQYQAIRDTSAKLGDGPAPDATQVLPPAVYRSMTVAASPPRGAPEILYAMAAPTMAAQESFDAALQLKSAGARPPVPLVEEVEAAPLMIPPTREDFPELAYLELFEFEGQAERVIPLGDQIGTWRCRAYLVSGLDVVELTADVQADKPLYAELDLPAIVAEGDEIEASVTYHSDGPAEMTLTLPDGETIRGMVMGHGTERFKLTGPGEVNVQLSGPTGQDWTTRTVQAPGVQTVTASRLELLRAGETITGQRVVVYPGVDLVLTDTIEALLRYPFG